MSSGTEKFEGFIDPYYTQIPDILFDRLMPQLSGSELKVLLYVMRRTYGFKKESDRISKSQMENGITTRDGRRLDYGTGLSRRAVRTAVDSLVERGVLIKENGTRPDGGNATTLYRLNRRDGVQNTPGVETTQSPGYQVPQQETEEQETVRFDHSNEHHLVISRYVEDFAREFRDQAPRQSSVTRAIRIFDRSETALPEFIEAMQDARARTKQYTSNIRAGEGGRRNLMAYWFRVLEDILSSDS